MVRFELEVFTSDYCYTEYTYETEEALRVAVFNVAEDPTVRSYKWRISESSDWIVKGDKA